MEYVFLIASYLLFITSYGICNILFKLDEIRFIPPIAIKLLMIIASVSVYILPVVSLLKLINIEWYWLAIINLVILKITNATLADLYCLILGVKTKPSLNWFSGKVEKSNMYVVDLIITYVLAVVLLILGIYS